MIIASCSLRFRDNYLGSGRVVGNPSFGGYFPLARHPPVGCVPVPLSTNEQEIRQAS
jgi:hypothetical protein